MENEELTPEQKEIYEEWRKIYYNFKTDIEHLIKKAGGLDKLAIEIGDDKTINNISLVFK